VTISPVLVRSGRSLETAHAVIQIQCPLPPSSQGQKRIASHILQCIGTALADYNPIVTFAHGPLNLLSGTAPVEEDNEFPHYRPYWHYPGMGASVGLGCSDKVSATLGCYIHVDKHEYILTVGHLIARSHQNLTQNMIPNMELASPAPEKVDSMDSMLRQFIQGVHESTDLVWEEEYALNQINSLRLDPSKFLLGIVEHQSGSHSTVTEHHMDWSLSRIVANRRGLNRFRYSYDDNNRELDFNSGDVDGYGAGEFILETDHVNPNAEVYFVGQGSGLSRGVVNASRALVSIDGNQTFEWTIVMDNQKSPFSYAGDSGAAVVERGTNKLVGHIWAQRAEVMLFTPIEAIFADIKQKLHAEQVGLSVNTFGSDSIAPIATPQEATVLFDCQFCRTLDKGKRPSASNARTPGRSITTSERRLWMGVNGCKTCSWAANGISTFRSTLSTETRKLVDLRPWSINKQKPDIFSLWTMGGKWKLTLDMMQNSPGQFGDNSSIATRFPNVPGQSTMKHVVEKMKMWMQECSLNHPNCEIRTDGCLPTRVLDLGTQESNRYIKLRAGLGEFAPYIALSYCWGDREIMLKSTKKSVVQWMEDIPWNQLPQTFQDAASLSRALGIRYLWIDALCIVQDDEEDREREVAKMANIYSGSYLTIAATRGFDSHAGLFGDRWTTPRGNPALKMSVQSHHVHQQSFEVQGEGVYLRPQLHLSHDRFANTYESSTERPEDTPLLTRAWCFQERLLSTRTVHFHAEELVWECKSAISCECEDLQKSYLDLSISNESIHLWPKISLARVTSEKTNMVGAAGLVWLSIVCIYSRLDITHERDRLPALSGVASSLAETGLGSYCAGLWSNDLARGLLFEAVTPFDSPGSKDPPSAPSWSWASIPLGGSVTISSPYVLGGNELILDPRFKVSNIRSTILGKNPYSWVSTAS
jgi:hypothetical protein